MNCRGLKSKFQSIFFCGAALLMVATMGCPSMGDDGDDAGLDDPVGDYIDFWRSFYDTCYDFSGYEYKLYPLLEPGDERFDMSATEWDYESLLTEAEAMLRDESRIEVHEEVLADCLESFAAWTDPCAPNESEMEKYPWYCFA